ncbi:hypothetical protein FGU71_03925 [Erythrobacter insulae]|uniref:Uncharacterized protein n=1 Tax=Erythrobacter insulae TaxID=2584124 RepID=A0A547PAB2_9SPHN|nr:hypothetical protein [Erythrobacter insulae]TRD11083.1 hypothetical protein FGU71_03925 [Erythrobacter insulae]
MIRRLDGTWQIVLADLALILFLVSLSSLASSSDLTSGRKAPTDIEFAPSQALFRPDAGGPDITEWLRGQRPDARATLTIHARYTAARGGDLWAEARALAAQATAANVPVRIVMTAGDTPDLYASLGYDVRPGTIAPGAPD